jgi:hypothetical protein
VYSKTKAVTLATAQALTGSDAVVKDADPATGVFDVRNNRELSLYLDWTKGGSATALEILLESSPVDSGDEWYPHPIASDASATFSSGVVTQTSGTLRYSFTATGKHHLPVRLFGARRFRAKAKETGAASGTLTAKITAVQEAS